jgi:chemotaxis protein methyltransferase CheR
MNATVSEKQLSDLSHYICSRTGMSFPRERWGELEKKIAAGAKAFGFSDTPACIEWLLSSVTDIRRIEMLSSCLTVGETFFFREPRGLKALVEHAFPEIIRAHAGSERRVRIWSAGCCTGEEPYSVAMLMYDYPGFRGWDVSILGTDINASFLRKAEAGIYTEWSFRGVDEGIKERFFRKSHGTAFAMAPSIKRMVTFARLNLIDDVYPALLNNTNAIDLILCRNVLMYFTPDHVQNVLQKLQQSLLTGGWLLVSPVEAPLVQQSLLTSMPSNGVVLHRKALLQTMPAIVPKARRPAPPPKHPRHAPLQPLPEAPRSRTVATLTRARELYTSADYDGAIEMLTALAAKPAAGASTFQLLARAFANRGMLAESDAACARAISADTLDAASQYLQALIRVEQKRPDEAMSALRKAIYLDPDFVVAHFTLASLSRRRERHAESERHFRNALRALEAFRSEEELPESEGMTAGKMIDVIHAARSDWGTHGQRRID